MISELNREVDTPSRNKTEESPMGEIIQKNLSLYRRDRDILERLSLILVKLKGPNSDSPDKLQDPIEPIGILDKLSVLADENAILKATIERHIAELEELL